MSSARQDHEAKLFEGLAEAGMDSMAFSQAAGRPPGLADRHDLKIQGVASPRNVYNPWIALINGFASIFSYFLGSLPTFLLLGIGASTSTAFASAPSHRCGKICCDACIPP